MAPLAACEAIRERLSRDESLRGLVVALTPSGQPTGETDLLRRFCLAPGPQDSPTYPLVLWQEVGAGAAERVRCGKIDSSMHRIRVWAVAPGRDLAALEPLADRIGELLGGFSPAGMFFALDAPWQQLALGASGEFCELGWEVLATVDAT
jgi:hypothetical protein